MTRREMFYHDFFRHFKIVIAAIGNYRYKFDWFDWNDFVAEFFSAGFEPKEIIVDGQQKFCVHEDDAFIATSGKNYGRHLVITTCQLTASISDEYLRKIADKVIDFAMRENIELIPEI